MSSFDRRAGMQFAAAAFMAVTIALAGPAFAQDAFRFGLAMPLTGSQALYGQDQVKAAEWAVAEINKAGGINGKKLEMIGARHAGRSAARHPDGQTGWSASRRSRSS